jgi:hypothetical protein
VAAPIPLLAPVTTAVRTGAVVGAELAVMVSIVVAHSVGVTPTALSRLAGVLGGLAWVARGPVDRNGGPDAVVNALHWGGLALVAIAVLGIGAGLVSGLPVLRVVVAVCLAALVWSLLEWLRGEYADDWVDGIFGVLLVVYCVGSLVRLRSRPRPPAERRTGSHAA